ncbi:MAG: hypothetical protein CMN76_08340 [Spirochaetaceae bacterium]|nr:hypothetical protein [Spirochaetaceae bacterium]|tara:strand:- start:87030 stop:88712 length:1683 start_codon:yes stop_codon:yes gene_type:complete
MLPYNGRMKTITVYWPFLTAALIRLLLHSLSIEEYGYFGDEFYYLSCAARLDAGYVDHPPLSVWLLYLVVSAFGDSLIAIRGLSVMAGILTIGVGWALVRDMKGGPVAGLLTCTSIALAPVLMGLAKFHSMNSLDVLFWTLAIYLFNRSLSSARQSYRFWILNGVVLGLGLLNKHGVLFLGAGFFAGMVVTNPRWLRRPQPYICAAVALAIFSPNLFWQMDNGWPTLEFIRNASQNKNYFDPFAFITGLILEMNPIAAPLWLSGFLALLVSGIYMAVFSGRERLSETGEAARFAGARNPGCSRFAVSSPGPGFAKIAASVPSGLLPYRWVSVALIAAFLIVFMGQGKSYYLAGAFPVLFAAGAVYAERWKKSAFVYCLVILGFGLALSPMSMPLLAPANYQTYESTLGVAPPKFEKYGRGTMPQHFAGMFGWPEIEDAALAAYESVPASLKDDTVIIGRNYFLAGPMDRLYRAGMLPEAGSGHNSFYLWGPPMARSGPTKVVIFLGFDEEFVRRHFGRLEHRSTIHCTECMDFRRKTEVMIGYDPIRPLSEIWSEFKRYN